MSLPSQDTEFATSNYNANKHSLEGFTRRKGPSAGKGKAKQGSVEWARKRTRNIERLLKRSAAEIPANVRNELDRELAAHKKTINDKSFQRRRSAMISKYHMVRFFERKKASRLVRQLRRQIANEEDNSKLGSLRSELHKAEVDEAYTLYFPHVEPYISLYSGSNSEAGGETSTKAPLAKAALQTGRPPMWSIIESAMDDGESALRKLRERRSTDETDGATDVNRTTPSYQPHPTRAALIANRQEASRRPGSKQQAETQSGLNRRERRRLMREGGKGTTQQGDGDDDDGQGFFEET